MDVYNFDDFMGGLIYLVVALFLVLVLLLVLVGRLVRELVLFGSHHGLEGSVSTRLIDQQLSLALFVVLFHQRPALTNVCVVCGK